MGDRSQRQAIPGREKFAAKPTGKPSGKVTPKSNPLNSLGGWFWESGFNDDPINDVERIRDLNLRAMYRAWDALKNVDKLYPNHRIGWAAFIAGKRESRRLMGDVVLTADNVHSGTVFPDAAFPITWPIDLHSADARNKKGSRARNLSEPPSGIRNISITDHTGCPIAVLQPKHLQPVHGRPRHQRTHKAIGPVRVMRTCGMMGEIVGKAASICVSQETTPRRLRIAPLDASGTHETTGHHPPGDDGSFVKR